MVPPRVCNAIQGTKLTPPSRDSSNDNEITRVRLVNRVRSIEICTLDKSGGGVIGPNAVVPTGSDTFDRTTTLVAAIAIFLFLD